MPGCQGTLWLSWTDASCGLCAWLADVNPTTTQEGPSTMGPHELQGFPCGVQLPTFSVECGTYCCRHLQHTK